LSKKIRIIEEVSIPAYGWEDEIYWIVLQGAFKFIGRHNTNRDIGTLNEEPLETNDAIKNNGSLNYILGTTVSTILHFKTSCK
jgi:hypothetical protein